MTLLALPRVRIEAEWYPVRRLEQLIFELPQVVLLLVGFAITLWLTPDGRGFGTHEQLGLDPCPAMVYLGIPCPSCGLTTSFAFMGHGHPVRAFQSHYFGPVLYLGLVSYLALLLAFLIRGQRIRMHWPDWVPLSLLFSALAAYVLCWAIKVIQYL